MVNCVFYYTGKSLQSTQQPTYGVDDTELKCELFDPLDIMNPVIIVDEDHRNDLQEGHIYHHIMDYNYVYVQSPISRYYWITGRERREGLWYISCSEDYLATFRDEIRKSQQYVIRCGNSDFWDNYISDNTYQYTLQGYMQDVYPFEIPIGWQGLNEGGTPSGRRYVIGINAMQYQYRTSRADDNPNGQRNDVNITDYLIVDKDVLYNTILPDIKRGGSTGDSENIQPIDYVFSIFALPITVDNSTTERDRMGINSFKNIYRVFFGNLSNAEEDNWDTNGGRWGKTYYSYAFPDSDAQFIDPMRTYSQYFTLRNYTTSAEKFESGTKYRKVYIQFDPFGKIEIPADFLITKKDILLKLTIQLGTGDAALYIGLGQAEGEEPGYSLLATSNVAIRIPYRSNEGALQAYRRQTIQNGLDIAQSAINNITSSIKGSMSGASKGGTAGAIAGGIIGGVTTALPLAQDIWEAADRPPAKVGGSVGGVPGCSIIEAVPKLIVEQYNLAERDDARFGRPCCKKLTLSQLGAGFVKCQNARFWGSGIGNRASATEKKAIEDALNGGIYID